MWPPSNRKFNHRDNIYQNRVTNIHNCDMDGQSYLSDSDYETTRHENIWTRSLYLHPGKVMVKTFDHQKREWMENLTREISLQK